jgi:hypothetical protein
MSEISSKIENAKISIDWKIPRTFQLYCVERWANELLISRASDYHALFEGLREISGGRMEYRQNHTLR